MYFDPGIGSLIIQTIIASIAVIVSYFTFANRKIRNLFGNNKNTENSKGIKKKQEEGSDETL